MSTEKLRVAVVGHGFMGRVHILAWQRVREAFPDLARDPEVCVLVGRDRERTARAAARSGVAETSTEIDAVLGRPDIDLIDICTPGGSHATLSCAALGAGKHVLCEKPMANSLAEAQTMADAAATARQRGLLSMVGFNYRRVPALGLARELRGSGHLGEIREARFCYLQDWLVDPSSPATWRLDAAQAGSGALGDLGAHLVDLAGFLLGELPNEIVADTRTFVTSRPSAQLETRSEANETVAPAPGTVPVTVDDAVAFLARFPSGALGTFEATRVATGVKNGLRLELYGTKGALGFDLERLNELWLFEPHFLGGGSPAGEIPGDPPRPRLDLSGTRRLLVTEPSHPYIGAWWPPGHTIGWGESFVHEMRDLVVAIARGHDPEPSFADGLATQAVLEAAATSASSRRWEPVQTPSAEARSDLPDTR
jgi:predicted dehydrogenase